MDVVGWETTSTPTVYEVYELLIMMLRKRLHEKVYCPETEKFISETHTLGLQLLRAYVCSFDSIG